MNIKDEIDTLVQMVDDGYRWLSGDEIHFIAWGHIETVLLGISSRLNRIKEYLEENDG